MAETKKPVLLPVELEDDPDVVTREIKRRFASFSPEFEPTYEDDEEGNAVIGLLAGKLATPPLPKSR